MTRPIAEQTHHNLDDMENKRPMRLLKAGIAAKLGKHADGKISYQWLTDPARNDLYCQITANTSGGYFSRELVPFSAIQACLNKDGATKPFPSKSFMSAFVGRSSNNAGFLTAILRAEALLVAATDAPSQHIASGDWAAWKKSALSETGTMIEMEALIPAEKEAKGALAADHTDQKKTLSIPRKKTP